MPQSHILLPSWHLEDVSRDLNEQEAAAVLNAYAVALHPWVLAAGHHVPRWQAAPSPGEMEPNRIIILPTPSQSKLPSGWLADAEKQGVIVLEANADREKTLQAVKQHPRLRELLAQQAEFSEAGALDLEHPPALEEAFISLGTIYLLTMLLSQAMYHYDNIDETRFTEYLLEAARAAIQHQAEKTREQFQLACEQLLEAREKFYPVEAHLIDLCLLGTGVKEEDLRELCKTDRMVNVLCTAEYIEQLHQSAPELLQELRGAFQAEKLSLLGGEYEEVPTVLLPIQVSRWQMLKGLATYQQHLQVTPAVWMRMRFGLSTQLPLILRKSGLSSAYHLVLDDGSYPDEEQSHFSWEGRSSLNVQGISRIPLSVENAINVLRIPERMAEAMNHDHLACVVLAHWPRLKNPWYQDLIRIQEFTPALGRFARLDQFLKETEDSGHYTNHEQRFYLSPYLDQLTGRKLADPISRFALFWQTHNALLQLSWLQATLQILNGAAAHGSLSSWEDRLQPLASTLKVEALQQLTEELQQTAQSIAASLAESLTQNGKAEAGLLVFNTLAHARNAVVEIPLQERDGQKWLPQQAGAVKHLQLNEDSVTAVVELPASGFAAVELQLVSQYKPAKSKAPLAGDFFLQNEFFYAQIDPETGGIQRLRVHGSNENLLSQRLVFRLDGTAGTVPRNPTSWGQSTAEPTYTNMLADSVKVEKTGPVTGEIAVQGRLVTVDQNNQGKVFAEFQLRYRIHRGSRNLQVEVELLPRTLPSPMADRSYYALRTAWAASAAKLRGMLHQSQFILGERRLESTGPVEIDDNEHRITLTPHFLPFHQRTAPRMLDTLLIAHGETARKFQYDIAVDAAHSASVAQDALTPAVVVPVEQLPRSASAWLFHLSAPSVQLVEMQPELPTNEADLAKLEGSAQCYRFDFLETEGRHCVAKFSLFRKPRKAWEVNFLGEIQSELTIEGDQITFECLPCDYLSVRVLF